MHQMYTGNESLLTIHYSCYNAALRHHAVRVTSTELGDLHNIYPTLRKTSISTSHFVLHALNKCPVRVRMCVSAPIFSPFFFLFLRISAIWLRPYKMTFNPLPLQNQVCLVMKYELMRCSLSHFLSKHH